MTYQFENMRILENALGGIMNIGCVRHGLYSLEPSYVQRTIWVKG